MDTCHLLGVSWIPSNLIPVLGGKYHHDHFRDENSKQHNPEAQRRERTCSRSHSGSAQSGAESQGLPAPPQGSPPDSKHSGILPTRPQIVTCKPRALLATKEAAKFGPQAVILPCNTNGQIHKPGTEVNS